MPPTEAGAYLRTPGRAISAAIRTIAEPADGQENALAKHCDNAVTPPLGKKGMPPRSGRVAQESSPSADNGSKGHCQGTREVSVQLTSSSETGRENWLEPIHRQWVATLDAIRDAICVIDDSKQLVRVNQSFAELAKSTFGELLQARVEDVLPWLVDPHGDIPSRYVTAPDGRTFNVRRSPGSSALIGQVIILEDVSEQHSLQIAEEKHRLGTVRSFVEAIDALSKAMEARDPYTVQHSRNVAKLAKAIARRIGLSSIEAQGIYYGAKVHDIGKLSVPTGILSRPGKLAQPEMNLIRMHSETGHAVVKDLSFPWPVHNIILQHHERLDGSGYPYGLEGDAIDLAARIVAVADVVEAMSAHRPYRAALGIDAAIAEIQKGREIRYDPKAVDACVEIFAENASFFSDGH